MYRSAVYQEAGRGNRQVQDGVERLLRAAGWERSDRPSRWRFAWLPLGLIGLVLIKRVL